MTVLRILHVDDDPGDRQLLREAVTDAGIAAELIGVDSGERALARLRGGLVPQVVLLDLNMRGLQGRDVLQTIRAEPALAALRVVIFTTSDAPSDRAACASLGSDGYLVKPSVYGELVELVRRIDSTWLAPHRGG